MKAQDLRIYNTVLCRGAVSVVTSIDQLHIGYLKSNSKGEKRIELRLVKPIRLTEEWLTTFEFVKEGNLFTHWKFDCSLYETPNGFESEQLPFAIYLKYVHEFQNLYYAFSKDELI